MTIMRVRRTLSETDIEMHGMLALMMVAAQPAEYPWTWQVIIITPVAVPRNLASECCCRPVENGNTYPRNRDT